MTTQTKTYSQRGQSANGTARLLDPRNRDAMRLLDAWDEATPEEVAEQRETWAVLEKGLRESFVA